MFKLLVVVWVALVSLAFCACAAEDPTLTSLAVGSIGHLHDWELHVDQIVDGNNLLGRVATFSGSGEREHEVAWFNIPTKGMVDGKSYRDWDDYEVTGTKQYTTALGATKTVFVLRPTQKLKIAKQEAAKKRAAAREEKRLAEEKAAQAEKDRRRKEYTRTWTDASGERKVTAEFLYRVDDKVKLKKEDGTRVLVPLDKLSEADRQWVEAKGKGKSKTEAPVRQ